VSENFAQIRTPAKRAASRTLVIALPPNMVGPGRRRSCVSHGYSNSIPPPARVTTRRTGGVAGSTGPIDTSSRQELHSRKRSSLQLSWERPSTRSDKATFSPSAKTVAWRADALAVGGPVRSHDAKPHSSAEVLECFWRGPVGGQEHDPCFPRGEPIFDGIVGSIPVRGFGRSTGCRECVEAPKNRDRNDLTPHLSRMVVGFPLHVQRGSD
jgi:hypothetical protein